MNITHLPLPWFADQLVAGLPFAFARYGDGEWLCMMGAPGANCDGHDYFPELGAQLRQSLKRPHPYLHAMGPKATHNDVLGQFVSSFIASHCPKLQWYSSETFLNASLAGELGPLLEALMGRKVLVVGPAHLQQLPFVDSFVEVPLKNCFLQKERIERAIRALAPDAEVIAFSAGMTAKVMIYDLWPELQAKTICDFGSLWDMYVGVDSRRYARRMDSSVKARLREQNGMAHAH